MSKTLRYAFLIDSSLCQSGKGKGLVSLSGNSPYGQYLREEGEVPTYGQHLVCFSDIGQLVLIKMAVTGRSYGSEEDLTTFYVEGRVIEFEDAEDFSKWRTDIRRKIEKKRMGSSTNE